MFRFTFAFQPLHSLINEFNFSFTADNIITERVIIIIIISIIIMIISFEIIARKNFYT